MADVPHSTLSLMNSSNIWKVNVVLDCLVVAVKRSAHASCRCKSSDPGQLQYLTSQKCTPEVCTTVRQLRSWGAARCGGPAFSSRSSQSSSMSFGTSMSWYPPLGHGSPPCPRWTTNPAWHIVNHHQLIGKAWRTCLKDDSWKNIPFHCSIRWRGSKLCCILQQDVQKTGLWAQSVHLKLPSPAHNMQILGRGGASLSRSTERYFCL